MADKKDFESLDELFRKTFDNLPDTPDKSGWDAPSDRVWHHVQTQIKPPRTGWTTQTLRLIAAFAVTLAVGLYLFLARTETPDTQPAAPTATETVETPANAKQEEVAETNTAAPETPASPVKPLKKKPAIVTATTPLQPAAPEQDSAEEDISAESATKPADKKIVSPNTTERRKAELARRATEAWKTPLQPLPQRWPSGKNQ